MLTRTVLLVTLVCASSAAFAQQHVSGYTRRDGTYVQGYTRSTPNSTRSDNYGPSHQSGSSYGSAYAPAVYVSPYARDKDGDGISNRYDQDDDNDGVSDNYDPNP